MRSAWSTIGLLRGGSRTAWAASAVVARAAEVGACAGRRRAHDRRPILPPRPRSSIAEPVAQHQRGRQEHRQRVGDPLPRDVGRGAVDRLEQARVRRRPSEAHGSRPIEPVSIAASSVRMSPNMFSVTITSKSARRRRRAASRRCRRACARARRPGTPRACTRVTTSRHSREVSSTLALSTRRDLASARAWKRGARDPLDLRDACRCSVS